MCRVALPIVSQEAGIDLSLSCAILDVAVPEHAFELKSFPKSIT